MTDNDIEHKLDELSQQVGILAGEVKRMQDGQYVTRSDLSAYLTVAAFEDRMNRMTAEIVTRVSGTLQAMVHDALDSAWKEDFRSLYREMSEIERTERRREMREDVSAVLGKTKLVVLYLVPFLTVINIVGQWLNLW